MATGTGDHEHCFCTLNTAGKPMCCKCGIVLEAAIIDFDAFMVEQQIKHNKEKEAKDCLKCGAQMIRASLYDPDGTISLYGGKKEYSDDGSLKEWWVCLNPACEVGKKNIVKG